MDGFDRKILRTLQRDGRLSNQALSEAVGLSPSPCLRRVQRLQRDGVITGYAALVDREAVGLSIMAFVHISLDQRFNVSLADLKDSNGITGTKIMVGQKLTIPAT